MKSKILLIAVLASISVGCTHNASTLTDSDTVNADFYARVADIGAPEYFSVFADSADMHPDELLAMKFLYAYMPLPDITDYPGEYFKENVKTSLQARREMPWGMEVPQREWMHFVLPVRVNNENLDGHRKVFYEQLRNRVKGMDMAEAILEVNHWCHEQATYEPSDSRTHSPLATVSSAIGRCGEESTFTVAALRSIGIPARQVYTPRWAHTDDNHAWVEAWADGRWHFLGACEPEAVLDLGWFNEPASRGMLMNTRTLGRYDGPEERLLETDLYTDINVTANYAAVDTLHVTVTDTDGRPVEGAKVDFCLYNYAEFYPIASKSTDADGRASIVAGLGDLMVWASNAGSYTMQKASVGRDKSVSLVVGAPKDAHESFSVNLTPPSVKTSKVTVPAHLAAECDRRKAYEDSLRLAYVSTFTDDSRGNRPTIDAFLASVDSADLTLANALLESLTKKDLTDVSLDVLRDAMILPVDKQPDEIFLKYVLSPRIDNEFLVPFREKFSDAFSADQQKAFRNDPSSWAAWVGENVKTNRIWQPSSVRMSPWSVWSLRSTDTPSRNIFFVAAARAMGIPARIEPVSSQPQYYSDGRWHTVLTDQKDDAVTAQGTLTLKYDGSGAVENPGYYYHFTISRIDNGHPTLLNYPEDATWRDTFSKPQTLDCGRYMLVSGQRMADGTVLAQVETFDIKPGENTVVPLTLRQDSEGVKVIGSFNSENIFTDPATGAPKSILSATGRGYYILGIVSAFDEPSNHALRDLAAKKQEIAASGLPLVLLFPTKGDADRCALATEVADIVTLGIDSEGKIAAQLRDNLKLGTTLPIFVIADTFNRVVYASQGYTIGIGQSLTDTAAKL